MIGLAKEPDTLFASLDGADSVFACRIKAMARRYFGSERVRFYTNGINCAVYIENGNAVVYASENMTAEEREELCESLAVMAREVRANVPLDLPGYTRTSGVIFGGKAEEAASADIGEELRACRAVWTAVFPEAFSGEAGMVRYADCAMYVRHGMAQAFHSASGAAFVFCEEDGYAVVDQLAVMEPARGNGEAMRILQHIAAVLKPERGFLFESRNEASDRFYRRNGFEQVGEWHRLRRSDVLPSAK